MRHLALAIVVILAVGCETHQGPTVPAVVPVATEPACLGVCVSGRVLNFVTNIGISGASVAFGDVTTLTDATGKYTLAIPAIGRYEPMVDGVWMGPSRVTGTTYRGDFFVRPGTCISRYGTLADAQTLRPIAGATVSLVGRNVISEMDGWYRIDLGCPTDGPFGFNTTLIYLSHPNYVDQSQIVGRGVAGVSRLDFELQSR